MSDDSPDSCRGLTRGGFLGRSRRGVRTASALVWLLFIVFPLANAVAKHGPIVGHALTIAGAAVFVASYVAVVMTWRYDMSSPVTILLFVVMVCVATALTVHQGSSWGFLFTYCAACAGFVTASSLGFYAVVLCATLAGVTSAIGGANSGTAVSFAASAAGIGLLMLVMRDLRLRNEELNEARAELAKLAVAEERERFARDLHDLLGHSLSVISLKAELAGRMLPRRPEQAATEVAEVEQVARTALAEVRDAVSGYRQPTLEGEIAGARMALSAAGIEADVQEAHVALDPAVEAVLAWAVREGATNVIRHSGAHRCAVRITASLIAAGVEVIDDGRGAVGDEAGAAADASVEASNGDAPKHAGGQSNGAGGHGLAGLAERARPLNGTIEAGTLAGGGYRLAVTVPVSHA